MALQLLAEAEVPVRPDDLLVRQAWGGRLAAAVLLLALGAAAAGVVGVLLFGQSVSSPLGIALIGAIALIAGIISILCLLGGAVFLGDAAAAMRTGNWVLRASAEALFIKLRHFADARLPRGDPVVAMLPRRLVRGVRGHDQRVRRVGTAGESRGTDDDALAPQAYLEIEVAVDLSPLVDRLAEERRLWVAAAIPGVRRRALGAAVSIRPDGSLRIDWHTSSTRLRPALAAALTALRRHYPIAPPLATEQGPAGTLDRAAQDRRLADMVRQGNTMDAVIIARTLYGFDLTRARRHVAGVTASNQVGKDRGPQRTPGGPPP